MDKFKQIIKEAGELRHWAQDDQSDKIKELLTRAWKVGKDEGYGEGYSEGRDVGYDAGYSDGCPD